MLPTARLLARAPYPWLVVAAGCNDFSFVHVSKEPPPAPVVVVVEEFVQASPPALDLLIVMDDSGSMAPKQEFVADNLLVLLDGLETAGVAWQVGVVRTDPDSPYAGWLQGSPWILTPSTPDREAALHRQVEVGTLGTGESGVAMAAAALDLAEGEGPNRGFRRPGAVLHVLFVSDGDDKSVGDDPEAALRAHLDEAAATSGLPSRVSAVVGPLPRGCASAQGEAQAGFRYVRLVEETEGGFSSICEADLSAVAEKLEEVAESWNTEFPLREAPVGPILVRVDGVRIADFALVDGVVVLAEAPEPGAIVTVSYPVALGGGA